MMMMDARKLRAGRMSLKASVVVESATSDDDNSPKSKTIDLGNESNVLFYPRFFPYDQSWGFFHFLDKHIPWTRPTIRVFGRSCLQVHKVLPGSRFNSLLLNRYKGGNDYVGWHADDEKLYGPTPEIASVSFGCEREFLLKKKKLEEKALDDEPARKRLKRSSGGDVRSFTLKHGSMLVMRGYTQRDWVHSVPKRAKAEGIRINLTFRRVV
ncbi:PREDICTED: DNA oxidative demethylase ALKBH2 isoform X2 [Tarenaya hassleriana]|uniref:DNA oxidative demethylase ALKBH2 isoform X2 n=1 Tax=Tarenaya hassleriana TaxID=28532 RepID=UPI00053C1F85|nr:PREDICTED: DNA oxidative demethylase ALKBH2 isoform X2 [Tarenaya hassleriana]